MCAAWKALPGAERDPYQKRYEAVKVKYETDLAAFTVAGVVKELKRPLYRCRGGFGVEKKKLEASAEASKVKYQAEHKAWKEAGGKALASNDASKKEIKDPNRPKKPVGGAFGCFLDKNRQALMKECTGQPVTAVMKLASTRWKALSEADMTPFEQAYQKKKAAYEEAMETYVSPAGASKEDENDAKGEEEQKLKLG